LATRLAGAWPPLPLYTDRFTGGASTGKGFCRGRRPGWLPFGVKLLPRGLLGPALLLGLAGWGLLLGCLLVSIVSYLID
jgi:hypothetical protein